MSHKNCTQFLINTMPRTGATWLQFVMSFILASPEKRITNGAGTNHVSTSTQYLDKFVIKMHHPIGLFARYDTFEQIYIARQPRELIASIVTKTLGGLSDTVSNGVAMPPEMDEKTSITSLVANQLHMYENYSRCAIANADHLKIYTFETITTNIEKVIHDLLGDDFNAPNGDIPRLMDMARKWIRVHDVGHPGYNNGMPTEKPETYFNVLKVIDTFNLDRVNELYEKVKELESI